MPEVGDLVQANMVQNGRRVWFDGKVQTTTDNGIFTLFFECDGTTRQSDKVKWRIPLPGCADAAAEQPHFYGLDQFTRHVRVLYDTRTGKTWFKGRVVEVDRDAIVFKVIFDDGHEDTITRWHEWETLKTPSAAKPSKAELKYAKKQREERTRQVAKIKLPWRGKCPNGFSRKSGLDYLLLQEIRQSEASAVQKQQIATEAVCSSDKVVNPRYEKRQTSRRESSRLTARVGKSFQCHLPHYSLRSHDRPTTRGEERFLTYASLQKEKWGNLPETDRDFMPLYNAAEPPNKEAKVFSMVMRERGTA